MPLLSPLLTDLETTINSHQKNHPETSILLYTDEPSSIESTVQHSVLPAQTDSCTVLNQ